MRITALVALTLALCTGPAVAQDSESLATRYGTLTYRASETHEGVLDVFLGYQRIVSLEAIGLSFHHVESQGPTEYAMLVSHVSGLNCRQELRALELKADKSYRVTDAFGSCSELASARRTGKGLIVETLGPFIQGRPRGHHRFKISNGKIIAQR